MRCLLDELVLLMRGYLFTHLWVESYGVRGWACAQVRAKQAADQLFKKWVEQVEAVMIDVGL